MAQEVSLAMKIFHGFRYFIVLLGVFVFFSLSVFASESSGGMSSILVSMEGNAEDIVDAALTRNAPATQKPYRKIRNELRQLHNHLDRLPFNERRSRELVIAYSWLRVIAIDLKQHAWIGTAIAANQLSASIIRFTNYPTLRKRDTAWLGYLARELLLLSREDPRVNAELLNVRRADLANTWQRVSRDLIKNFRNKTLVMRGGRLIGEIQKEHEPAQTIKLSSQLLDFVGRIKKVK
jgi:hypothetical protein